MSLLLQLFGSKIDTITLYWSMHSIDCHLLGTVFFFYILKLDGFWTLLLKYWVYKRVSSRGERAGSRGDRFTRTICNNQEKHIKQMLDKTGCFNSRELFSWNVCAKGHSNRKFKCSHANHITHYYRTISPPANSSSSPPQGEGRKPLLCVSQSHMIAQEPKPGLMSLVYYHVCALYWQ